MKKNNILYSALVFSFLFVLLISGIILGMTISLIFGKVSFVLLKIAFINSLFLSIGMFFNFYAVNFLLTKIKFFFVFLLSFLITLGISVIGFLYIVFDEPFFFFYETNLVYSYLLINFLFILPISGIAVFQKLITEKEERFKKEELLRKEIEEKLYVSKINPHFLFNSLSLIVSLLKDPKKAEKAILSLSELLRENIESTKKNFIFISKELESVEKYFYIQKLRFEDRLIYEIIKEDDFLIPPMIIQPMVENSIKHNIDKLNKLQITVKAFSDNKDNIILISDSAAKITGSMIGEGSGLSITKKRVELAGGVFIIADGIIEMRFKK